jgi:Exodeoxyribonuclease VII small subunit (EC 3.1.11.6)
LLELEGIVKTMESGDLSLEDSLKYFEQGVQLTRQCQSALSAAEQKISLLSADDDYQTQKPLD